jgi:transcriptional regulator with XRE-family HTH domain
LLLLILSTLARALTHSLPSHSLEAAVRAHFGLTQAELARYLGTSSARIADFEAGRRRAPGPQYALLDDLGRLLPPPEGSGPPAPVFEKPTLPAELPAAPLPAFGPLPAAPLRRRLRQVLASAARLRLLLHQQARGRVVQQRRQWGLGVLQAGLLAGSGPAAPDANAQAHRLRWLATLAADVAAAAPGPAAEAAQALQVVRLLALDLEAAALARLLGDK